MSCLRVAPIVEGYGEVAAVRVLLERTWTELVGGEFVDVLTPIRCVRTKLIRPAPGGGARVVWDEVVRAVSLAARKLRDRAADPMPELILPLLDADTDCPRDLAPQLLDAMHAAAPREVSGCVLAKVEYETWFVAGAETLREYLKLAGAESIPTDPEGQRCGKQWIAQRFAGAKYSETVDQPRLTAAMDLRASRQRGPSFDKLCRILEAVMR